MLSNASCKMMTSHINLSTLRSTYTAKCAGPGEDYRRGRMDPNTALCWTKLVIHTVVRAFRSHTPFPVGRRIASRIPLGPGGNITCARRRRLDVTTRRDDTEDSWSKVRQEIHHQFFVSKGFLSNVPHLKRFWATDF